MGDLSRHFDRQEFACKCGCGRDTVDYATLLLAENVRTYFDAPVIINSACRCEQHNAAVGGAPSSQHLRGRALDIVVEGVPPRQVADYVDSGPLYKSGGVGNYETFTHIDTRTDGPARWTG